jgi:bifunctional non-homologous end joining protein LigD
MRLVAYVNDPKPKRPLRLVSTRGHDAVPRFPELVPLAEALAPHTVVLDGEMVAFERDRPNFGQLQMRMQLANPAEVTRRMGEIPVTYVLFDIMYLDGHDLTGLHYLDRRKLLADLVEEGPAWRVPGHYLDDGAGLLEVAREHQLEGIMAKRQDSLYLAGKRSPLWTKVKVRNRQEFVIGGWHPGTGNREGLVGSLLLGYYDADKKLRYGGKVGTGFKDRDFVQFAELFAKHAAAKPPFDPPPPPSVARTAHWVRPKLVAEVTFGEWTSEGILRHSSFEGLRTDKDPKDVVRES